MNNISIGDLASSYLLQKRSSALKTEMTRLTEELSSGRVSDVKNILSGNYGYLTDIESSLKTLEAYNVSIAEASQYSSAVQNILENVNEISSIVSNDLITATMSGSDAIALHTGKEAYGALDSAIEAMNTRSAGRALFSGSATDQAPLGNADQLLDELKGVLSGVTGAAAKVSTIKDWFDDPSGYDTVFYSGSDAAIGKFVLSNTETINLDIRATDKSVKDTLMYLSIAALSSDTDLGIDAVERQELLTSSHQGLLQAQDELISLRAHVGYSEARIETAKTRNESESTSLEYAKGSLLEADPYNVAIRLEEVQFQLQSLFTITAKSAQISLVNYL